MRAQHRDNNHGASGCNRTAAQRHKTSYTLRNEAMHWQPLQAATISWETANSARDCIEAQAPVYANTVTAPSALCWLLLRSA